MIPPISPEAAPTTVLVTTVLWQAANGIGLDRCQLRRLGGLTSRAYRLTGLVVDVHDGRPIRIRYRIDLDRAWRTTDVLVRASLEPGNDQEIALRRRGRWRRHDPATGEWERVRELDGLTDIDLAFTPATNTLPIRRLDLSVGGSATVTAAWLTFPALTLKPLTQTYTRAAQNTYHYQSPNFDTTITTDPHGLVLDYPPLWSRLAHHP